MGKMVLEYEDMGDITEAELSMDAASRAKKDRPEFSSKYLPLPITHKDFQLNVRQLEASRTRGESLDVTGIELATRKVNEKTEDMLFNGASAYSYGGGIIRGYTDHPNRNTGTLRAAWDASSTTGAMILADTTDMKQASITAKHYGPWVMYIPTEYETKLDENYTANYPGTIRKRILEIAGIEDIKTADYLTGSQVLLVQMTSDVVRLVEGLPITPVEWTIEGGTIFNFKVMTIRVPQIRADQDGNSGVVHYSE